MAAIAVLAGCGADDPEQRPPATIPSPTLAPPPDGDGFQIGEVPPTLGGVVFTEGGSGPLVDTSELRGNF